MVSKINIDRLKIISQPQLTKRQLKIMENENLYRKLLSEKRGSFPNQYQIALTVLNKIIKTIEENNERLIRDNDGFFNVIIRDSTGPYPLIKYIFKWGNYDHEPERVCKGVTTFDAVENIPLIKLTVNSNELNESNIITTIAHEIMHCYQSLLYNVGNIDDKFYKNILNYIRYAPSDFTKYLFYGLYITFDIEINANVSTIESLLMHAGQDIPLFDEEIDKIIRDSDKYQLYFDIFNYFNNNPHYTQDDANYIIPKLGNKQTIEKIIKKILKKCKYFFMKVEKNKLNYIENRKK